MLFRRILLVLTGTAAAMTLGALPAAASSTSAASCVSASAATYRHSFNGRAGRVTITAERPLCANQKQTFSLVSYTTGALDSASNQFVYDSAQATITSAKSKVTLDVAVPACFAQVDAVIGGTIRTETTSTANPYGTATLGTAGSRSTGPTAWYAAGDTACTATSTVSFTNACDGTFTATLANDRDANAQAVFLTGSRRIRLAPGRTTTIKAARNSTLTIRTSTFTTYVGTWRPPATPCTTQARPAATRPAAVIPVAAPVRAAAPAPTTSPTAAVTSAGTAEPPAPMFSVNPAALPTTAPTPLSGSGLGSFLATAIGVVLMGGGVAILRRLLRKVA